MGTIWSRTEEPAENTAQESPATHPDEASETRKKEMEEDMRRFKADLAAKREARKEAIAGLNRKIAELKDEVDKERKERERLESMLGDGQDSRAEIEGLEKQVRALKDVASIGGEMLRIRELQVNELKDKLQAIEETGVAYEKEVENMRRLKGLYEERSRAMAISHQMELEREKARVVAAETRLEISEEKNRELQEGKKELEGRITALDATVDKNNNEISELRVQLAGKKEELYTVTSQMTIVNNLFSQVLLDPENLDRVNRVLEEHHNLVNHLTEKGKITDVASVLMTVADKDHVLTQEEQDIATNLSKVWKLLVELLGHHNKQATEDTMPDSCYKSVDTPSGPKLVISVSKTFLRLKDLILEKNSLVKEVGRLKDLNCHLEKRLVSQETRLAEVAEELHKTWGVVNKLKTQHKALHTHEQVLRYELKHKRLMLNELKQQLEDCREMWQMARVKNSQTEKDWILLRQEFADRKQQVSNAESGYEESPGDSQDEEDSHKLSEDEGGADSPEPVSDAIDESAMSGCTSDRPNTPEGFTFQGATVAKIVISPDNIDSHVDLNHAPEESSKQSGQEEFVQHLALDNHISDVPISTSVQSVELESKENRLSPVFTETTEELTDEMPTTISILPWDEGEPPLSQSEIVKSIKTPEDIIVESYEAPQGMVMDIVEVQGSEPSCSSNESNDTPPVQEQKKTSAEEILARREARLKRLEEQCKHLFSKMNNTNMRSEIISNKLVELHEHYGEGRSEVQDQGAEGSNPCRSDPVPCDHSETAQSQDSPKSISTEEEVTDEPKPSDQSREQ
ncbi:uncharacterized protein [Halyomorpha halys]|uniref:uncharacterized protein n=1 Tax=Halyomorpha halys TaxID=286706 RepID=UPI0006D4E2AE|nr:myosin-10 [Halyomorpha halys]XP_014281059.1 myosin-10 [Halyomorpha halys]